MADRVDNFMVFFQRQAAARISQSILKRILRRLYNTSATSSMDLQHDFKLDSQSNLSFVSMETET
jgi:hypothetical protein